MIKVNFTEKDIQQLRTERYHHPHPRVQRRMEALYLKSQGLKHGDICRLTGFTEKTLTTLLHQWNHGGIESVKLFNFRRPQSELDAYTALIESYFSEHPVRTIPEAVAKIEELTGLHRSATQVGLFLKKLGFKRRKIGMVPAKAKPEEQAAFLKEQLQPRLQEAIKGTKAVLFVDAAHFVYAAFLGYIWCLFRQFLPAPSGRQRFNVLAALDAITHRVISVTNTSYINAECVCDLIWKISIEYADIPVTLVLDNARYLHCSLVMKFAEELKIELLFLPPYSPNLNLIERLWKFTKKQCLYSKWYPNFQEFYGSIQDCLNHTSDWHKKALDTLLTLNFQTFVNVKFVTV